MHKALISSQYFQNSYAIFISRGASTIFNDLIRSKLWNFNYGIKVIDAEFDQELSCITIPTNLNFYAFEKELYEFKIKHKSTFIKETQFWGQLGLGYEGKHWSIV